MADQDEKSLESNSDSKEEEILVNEDSSSSELGSSLSSQTTQEKTSGNDNFDNRKIQISYIALFVSFIALVIPSFFSYLGYQRDLRIEARQATQDAINLSFIATAEARNAREEWIENQMILPNVVLNFRNSNSPDLSDEEDNKWLDNMGYVRQIAPTSFQKAEQNWFEELDSPDSTIYTFLVFKNIGRGEAYDLRIEGFCHEKTGFASSPELLEEELIGFSFSNFDALKPPLIYMVLVDTNQSIRSSTICTQYSYSDIVQRRHFSDIHCLGNPSLTVGTCYERFFKINEAVITQAKPIKEVPSLELP